ncbi:MAG: sigma-54-dependent Fis family transcriptional regulator [Ignavibacteriales bacterium]|nr:sigma-54-dependent Fis family transcriptional regulator [Ignavibacteriales bacterium]
MFSSARILIIDDEPDMLSGLAAILEALGYRAFAAGNATLALEMLLGSEFDIIFCDLQMPALNGIQFLEKARKIAPDTPVVIFTAYGTIERAVEAMKNGAYDFIEKPINTDLLKNVLTRSIAQRKLYKERAALMNESPNRYGAENIVGKSKPIEKIFEMAQQVAGSDVNVLITGESGTGKELIARYIHTLSNRKNKPFVPVNCGALPEALFESEIFGHEKGAFTGASRKKIGLLEYANGGVFFLDEVCELPLAMQVKMLRVIQDKCLRRLGSNGNIDLYVRILSATNRNVSEFLESGKMRNDFYYRINVINLHLPPLREREDDILLLSDFFLDRSLKSSLKNIKGFAPEVIALFRKFRWPGNVRQLENIIERAVVLTKSDMITCEDLPVYLLEECKSVTANHSEHVSLQQVKQQVTSDIEKKTLLRLLEKYHGNITRVAEDAGMTRRNVHRLINLHNIDPDTWRHTE